MVDHATGPVLLDSKNLLLTGPTIVNKAIPLHNHMEFTFLKQICLAPLISWSWYLIVVRPNGPNPTQSDFGPWGPNPPIWTRKMGPKSDWTWKNGSGLAALLYSTASVTNKQTLFSWLFYLLFIYLESLQPYSYDCESGVLHHLQKEAREWIIDLLMLR